MPRKRHTPPREDDVARVVRQRAADIPHCEVLDTIVLKPGPSTYQVATLLEFRDPQTGLATRRSLHVNDFPFRVLSGMKWAVKDRLAHWECGEAQWRRLGHFLATAGGDGPNTPDGDLQTWVAGLSFPQLTTLVDALAERSAQLRLLPAGAVDRRARTAAALRAAHRATALVNLRQLIDRRAQPAEFRALLENHAWMLGRLYLEQCTEPALAGDPGELLLLRTADAGLDVVLLMPLDAPLVTDDPAGGADAHRTNVGPTTPTTAAQDADRRTTLAPSGVRRMTGHARSARPGGSPKPVEPVGVSAEVVRAVAYAAACIGQLTEQHGQSLAAWGVEPARISARIVLGYLDPFAPQSAGPRRCLEQFNARFSGVEVCGYDRLAATAENVLESDLAECGVDDRDAPPPASPRRPLF